VRGKDQEVLMDELRYLYRRETVLELLEEIQEEEEAANLIPRLLLSRLQRSKSKFELYFGMVLGMYLGVTAVFMIYTIIFLL
jgi:hypothetical protein